MTDKMAKMVKATAHGKTKKPPVSARRPRAVKVGVKQATPVATDDLGLGGIIGMGARTIIGVGLLGGLAGTMGGMHIGGGMPPGGGMP
jgi:hypothetical protein